MGILPKRKPPVVNQRAKAVPGFKAVEPPAPVIETKELPKTEPPKKALPKRPTPAKAVPKQEVKSTSEDESILALINRRQRQVIVHSVIYYRMNDNIVSDTTWNEWARELGTLQKQYPELTKQSVFYEDMIDFDPATGFDLADHPWGMQVAPALLEIHKRKLEGRESA